MQRSDLLAPGATPNRPLIALSHAPHRMRSNPQRSRRRHWRRALAFAQVALGAFFAALLLLSSPLVAERPHLVKSSQGVTGSPTAPRPPAKPAPPPSAVGQSQPTAADVPPAQHIDARLEVPAHASMRSIPPSFLGISTEYWALPFWAHHLSLLDRVLANLHGPGPLVLRIGGESADRTFWSPLRSLPRWAFNLTPAWLREVKTIVRHTGARLILDLNLVTATPTIAVRWARIAEATLPAHSIIGFEIGNEPDLYSRLAWQAAITGRAARLLPAQITPSSYATGFSAYSSALSRAAPGIPLLGPALAEPGINLDYLTRLLSAPHPGLSSVTVHRYPYSACVPRWSSSYPTIARVLSENATAGMARTLLGAERAAHQAGLPLRLSELNSVTCGGVKGVSNTFATALWAPDALFELVRAGVSSANVHVRADAINAAFSIGRRGLTAHPLLYGMMMFNRMLGTHPELVSVRLHARLRQHLKAWAVRSGKRLLRVLLINKARRDVGIRLDLPSRTAATVQRLLAPSVRATRGVSLDGQHLAANATWRGRRSTSSIPPRPPGYILGLPRYSAALITVRVRAGALRGTTPHPFPAHDTAESLGRFNRYAAGR